MACALGIDLGQVNVDVKPQAFLRRVPNSQHHENPAVNSDAYALDLRRDRSGAKPMWTVDERLRSDVRRPGSIEKALQTCRHDEFQNRGIASAHKE